MASYRHKPIWQTLTRPRLVIYKCMLNFVPQDQSITDKGLLSHVALSWTFFQHTTNLFLDTERWTSLKHDERLWVYIISFSRVTSYSTTWFENFLGMIFTVLFISSSFSLPGTPFEFIQTRSADSMHYQTISFIHLDALQCTTLIMLLYDSVYVLCCSLLSWCSRNITLFCIQVAHLLKDPQYTFLISTLIRS